MSPPGSRNRLLPVLSSAAALFAAGPAHALDCGDVVAMLASGLEPDLVVSAMRAEATPVANGGAACLAQQGAAALVVAAAQNLETAASAQAQAAPVLTRATTATATESVPVQTLRLQETYEVVQPPKLVAAVEPMRPPPPVAPRSRFNKRRLGMGLGVTATGLVLLGASSALRASIQSDLEAQAQTPEAAGANIGLHNSLVYAGYGLVAGGAATAGSSFLTNTGATLTWRARW